MLANRNDWNDKSFRLRIIGNDFIEIFTSFLYVSTISILIERTSVCSCYKTIFSKYQIPIIILSNYIPTRQAEFRRQCPIVQGCRNIGSQISAVTGKSSKHSIGSSTGELFTELDSALGLGRCSLDHLDLEVYCDVALC